MSQEETKCPCNSCGGNISFPAEAIGMVVPCPHCSQETTLYDDDAVAVAPLIVAIPDTDPDPGATLPPASAAPPKPPLPKSKSGKKGGAPPPPRPAGLKAPPPSTLTPSAKPPPAPRTGLGLLKRPGAMAVSRAGVGRKLAPKVKSLWDDEDEEVLQVGEKRCGSCGSKVKDLKICPSCGDVLVGWLKALRWTGGLIIVGLAVTAFLNYRRLYPPPVLGPNGEPQQGGVQMLGHQMKKEKYGDLIYIRGVVTNHSPVDFFYVKVEFEILDAAGKVIGNASDQQPVISSNAVWNFKAMVMDPDAQNYQGGNISAIR